MSDCSQPEADSRIILHVSNCIQMILINVYVRKNDTGEIILLVAFTPDFLQVNTSAQVIAICGVGTQKYCMSINVIAKSVTLERSKELLFLHALSGSDYTSSFFHVGKVKFWNSWFVNQDVPETFTHLGNCPSLPLREEDTNIIERFIISLYYDDWNCFSIIWKFDLYCRQEML